MLKRRSFLPVTAATTGVALVVVSAVLLLLHDRRLPADFGPGRADGSVHDASRDGGTAFDGKCPGYRRTRRGHFDGSGPPRVGGEGGRHCDSGGSC